MNFLIDVNASGVMSRYLREHGHNVMEVAEKNQKMSDDDILSWAVREHRIIVTTDNDFEEMIWRQKRPHCGVLRMENLPRFQRITLLHDVLSLYANELETGAIIIAANDKYRIRWPYKNTIFNEVNSNGSSHV